MMKPLVILIFLLALVAAADIQALDGVKFALSVYQRDVQQSQDVLLYADTVDIARDIEATGFLATVSVSVKLTNIDSIVCEFMVHANTLSPQPGNYARNYRVEYGLPTRIERMNGKADTEYSLQITPLEPVEMDTSGCHYLHYDKEHFRFDPSGHMDIYYVPFSLGDFYWNTVKAMLEEEYDRFEELNSFNMPGKYNLYLCPCELHSIIWDKRFGMMVDPTRGNMFAIFSPWLNSAYPFILSQAAIFRNYGYAPAFLSEGYAGYLSFAIYGMKKLHAEGKNIPLDDMLDTYGFFTTDPYVADRTAAAFVRFLIGQYGFGRFLELYRMADDLNLRRSMEQTYGKSVEDLESEWLTYVDTVTIAYARIRYYGMQAESMRDYDLMLEYAQVALSLATNRGDTLSTYAELVRASFLTGAYYDASSYQQKMLSVDSTDTSRWMSLAAYRMMNGEFEQALADLNRARDYDSTNQLITFNLALNYLNQGREDEARQMLLRIVRDPNIGVTQVEGRVMLGNILLHSDNDQDRAEAVNYFTEVVGMLAPQGDQRHNPSAVEPMWLGIAYLGLGDTGNAYEFLRTALFLQSQPFYLGMIQLWLGKTADVRGEHDVAREHYGQVLAGESAFYHKDEARKYLESPYQQQ